MSYNPFTYLCRSRPLPTRFATPAALLLALLGQVAGVVGLPAIGSEKPDAACGCCPADREALRCCCVKTPAKPSCCQKPVEDVPSCCSSKKKEPVRWVNPVLQQKCKGPSDSVSGSPTFAGIEPVGPVSWSFEAVDAGSVPIALVEIHSVSQVPDAPPPRA